MSKSPTQPRHIRRLLTSLPTTQPQTIHLRDGELVLYRRSRSLPYQCRYKLADGTWHRQSTGKASLELAIAAACDLYDESRYRQKLGLAHQAHAFAQIAGICFEELRHLIDLKKTKSSLNDYASIIERYFVPYFGERQLGAYREFRLPHRSSFKAVEVSIFRLSTLQGSLRTHCDDGCREVGVELIQTHRRLNATPKGPGFKPVTVATTEFVAVSMMETESEVLSVTKSLVPSGVTVAPLYRRPTEIVDMIEFVAVFITVTIDSEIESEITSEIT